MASFRSCEEAELFKILKREATKLAGDEADESLLEYIAAVTKELFEENSNNMEDQLNESLTPYLSSFLDDTQAGVLISNLLEDLSLNKNCNEKPAETVVIEDAPLPVPVQTKQAETKWVQPPSTISKQQEEIIKPIPVNEDPNLQMKDIVPLKPIKSVVPHISLTKSGGGQGTEADLCDTVFSMAFGGRTLLARTRLHLTKGRRYGLVGANGAGKSTLLRNLAGKRLEGLPPSLRVALVQHEADSTVPMGAGGEAQLMHDKNETVLNHLLRHATETDNEVRCISFAKAVGFETPESTMVSTLSGGWNMRLSLARAMMAKAELLLLDEPTNHLDIAGVEWLVQYLQGTDKYDPPITVVVVSHDAIFLDKVVTDVLLLAHRQRRLESYEGSYSTFREAKPEVHAYLTRRTDRSGNDVMTSGDKFSLTFPAPDRIDGVSSSTKTVLRIASVTFAYPASSKPTNVINMVKEEGNNDADMNLEEEGGDEQDNGLLKVVLRNVECRLTLKSKVAVLGGNGAGKSTLVRLLVGDLLPLTGDVWKNPSLRIAYVAQHSLVHIEQHLAKTPVEYMQWRFNNAVDREALSMSALQETSPDVDDDDGDEMAAAASNSERRSGGKGEIECIIARRSRHGSLEYEIKFVGKGHDENEWRTLARLQAEGFSVLAKRYDQVHAGKAAGLDLRPLTTQEVSNHLVDFGLDQSFATYTKIGGLSGGQKSKLVFAAAMWSKPHVLVLDEPTNYLDRETLEALKSALRRFKGAFVVVSHNRDFVTGLCSEEWRVESGRVSVVKVETENEGGNGGNATSVEPISAEKAAAEAELVAKGAHLLKGDESAGSIGSWAKGTVTNANAAHSSTLVKDTKGKTLSKKDMRILEKKQKAAAAAAANGSDDKSIGEKNNKVKETAAEKKAKREAKKLMKEGVDVSKLDPKFSSISNVKKTNENHVQLTIKMLEEELEQARVQAARVRSLEGGYFGAIATENFTLPNPGGGENLIDDASFILSPGRIYGLIGRNGSGKSTLLRHLAARRVTAFPTNVSVHYVSQEVSIDKCAKLCPIQVVVDADVERSLLLADLAELQKTNTIVSTDGLSSFSSDDTNNEQSSKLISVLERLEVIEADSAVERAETLLGLLGFPKDLLGKTMAELSGGWRVRVSLASAIFARPDILLLDEPTNHLSIQAVLWLAHELNTEAWANRIVVVVSHDRFFLDEVCSDTLHLSARARHVTPSRGNYSTWQQRRTQLQAEYAHRATVRSAEREKLAAYAGHGFKYGGSDAQINMMKMKAKQVEKLDREAELDAQDCSSLQEDLELPLKLLSGWSNQHDPTAPKELEEGEVQSGYIVEMKDVAFSYYPQQEDDKKRELFSGVEFNIDASSRIVLLGENGNGKTTLVKLILGQLTPTVGQVRRNPACRVAMVNQHHADQLDLSLSALAFMKRKFPGDGSYNHDQRIRSHLATMGLSHKLMTTPALALSGGQRSRVALAATSYERPHLLVLDEPTNNLDLEAVEALADAVEAFRGGVILVSHDQYFVSRVAKTVKVVGNGMVKDVESFEGYRKAQMRNVLKN